MKLIRLPLCAEEPRFGRRTFLEWALAATVTTGVGACTRERGRLAPYSAGYEAIVPGNFLDYSTVFVRDGLATGVIVATREGRPIKVEGNPDHPASLGATGVYEQASLMDLYNPGRSGTVWRGRNAESLQAFLRWMIERADGLEKSGGAGLRLLLEPSSSLFLDSLRARITARFPNSRTYSYSPLSRQYEVEGVRLAFGRTLDLRYELSRARTVVAFDSDLLTSAPGHLVYARQLADRRDSRRDWMSRIYVFEAGISLLGMLADHRMAIRSSDVGRTAVALLGEVARLLVAGGRPLAELSERAGIEILRGLSVLADRRPSAVPERWLSAIAHELVQHTGEGLVVTGARQPPVVHAVACALNRILQNQGSTVSCRPATLIETTSGPDAIVHLADEIERGLVDTLIIDAFDPVYSAPVDLDFRTKLRKVPASVYRSLYQDETSELATWHLPAAHDAESWGDSRAYDGTIAVQQPLIEPLFGGVTSGEVLGALVGDAGRKPSRALRDYWQSRVDASDFEHFWEDTLARGLVPGTETAAVDSPLQWGAVQSLIARSYPDAAGASAAPIAPNRPSTSADGRATPLPSSAAQPGAGAEANPGSAASAWEGLEIDFVEDLTVYDGRYSNNGWLLELPDPVTRLSWQNAAMVSPALAARWNVQSGDVIELRYRGRVLRAPVLILPMIADHAVALPLGWGRRPVDHSAPTSPVGVNAYRLRTAAAPWFDLGLAVRKTNAREDLIIVQGSQTTEGRPIALSATVAELGLEPDRFAKHRGEQDSLYPKYPYVGPKWAMAIDLSRCIGCGACVAACNSENNIAVVGPVEVAKGREMQWLRIDRYFEAISTPAQTHAITMPLACVHCENAPCEYVCPVNATTHSSEGLNQMVYNRCVGTRFCSNNCPYKVRRFNWFAYQHDLGPLEQMRMNPEVTVRSRGVMEKCSYCIQRIERARIAAERKGSVLRGSEVTTACQQACPTTAIVFGSLSDESSAVAAMHADQRSYRLLHELGTRPRTAHLARIKNPNPELG